MENRFSTQEKKIILVIMAVSFLQGLQYCVSPVLGEIHQHYNTVDLHWVQMLVAAPSILAIIVALLSGGIVNRVGKRRLLLTAALISGITGIQPLIMDDFHLLFVSRVIYGIGLGIATSLSAAVIADFFTGEKRVKAMGLQAASVGTGMVLITSLSGFLGKFGFQYAYWVNIIGFISFAVIFLFLPEVAGKNHGEPEKVRLNRKVFVIAAFGFLEFLFLITFTTNIALHISGTLQGNTAVTGLLTGIFSASQILIGLVLKRVTKYTGQYTLPVAMLSFCLGAVLLLLFPGSLIILGVGAIFCGFSQGVFIPTAYVEEANAVDSASVSMASAVFTSGTCLGQILSPILLNRIVTGIYGTFSTKGIYTISAAGMVISAAALVLWTKCSVVQKR